MYPYNHPMTSYGAPAAGGFHIASGFGLMAPAPAAAAPVRAGRTQAVKAADEMAKSVGVAMKEDIEAKTGKTYETFEVTHMATQNVAGTNYFLKIDVGEGSAVHARIYRGFDGVLQLVAVQSGKTTDDQLVYFQNDSIGSCCGAACAPAKLGGMKGVKPCDATAQAVADAVRASIDAKLGGVSAEHTVVSYATQTVAGTNFFLKINRGDDHVHARVFRGFNGALQLVAVQAGKSGDDALEYFQNDAGLPAAKPAKLGGMKGVKPGDDTAQAVAAAVQEAVEAKTCATYGDNFKVVEYATQTVAGTNYFLKIDAGDAGFLFVRAFVGFSGHAELAAVQTGKTADDPLVYFSGSAAPAPSPAPAPAPHGFGAPRRTGFGFGAPAPRANGNGRFGAASAPKPGDEKAQAVADAVRADIERLDHAYSEYSVKEYLTQTVAGVNYFLNIAVGGDEFVHARVFQGFDGAAHVVKLRPARTADHKLCFF
ncbi:cystatin-A2 [Thecamonas trahens ATCC 50062]|uniref:Cystatin-A2 n=1 Tax=Thecamonas trahens ATCC 50062 TaxID=461836 RepID=A0A0L0D9X4_THETB|nr:cystatin-A2 [Thecamonas trahens ATCC 50062]KNC49162.1 cystatin-A2 [Thecamonas trahens ATCC 50062]|eukprot:XP_013758183.1 cystatin-A2 [Thecamonas trahens ATCC 50062]